MNKIVFFILFFVFRYVGNYSLQVCFLISLNNFLKLKMQLDFLPPGSFSSSPGVRLPFIPLLCMESTLHKLVCVKAQHLCVRLYIIFLLHIKIITKRSFLTLILLRALNSKIMVYNLLYNLKLSKLIVVNKTIVALHS